MARSAALIFVVSRGIYEKSLGRDLLALSINNLASASFAVTVGIASNIYAARRAIHRAARHRSRQLSGGAFWPNWRYRASLSPRSRCDLLAVLRGERLVLSAGLPQ